MKGMIKLNNNSLWRIILAVGMVVTLCFCSVGCGSDTAKLPSSDEISSSDTYVEVDKIESAEDSLSAAEAERAGDPELVLSTVGTQTQTDSLIVTQKEFVVTAPQYHPGIPGYDLKFTLDVRFNELPVNGDDYTIVSDLAGVEVNQNVVRVPANVKEANDRMTLTVTYKKDTSYQCKLVLAFKHWTPTLIEEFEEPLDDTIWNTAPVYGLRTNNPDAVVITNSTIKNGKLQIETKKQDVEYQGKTYHYTGGRLDSSGKFYQKFGCFTSLIKMPEGGASLCSFWMQPQGEYGYDSFFTPTHIDDPLICSEIDIFEHWPSANGQIGTTEHFWNLDGTYANKNNNYQYKIPDYTPGKFYEFSCVWTKYALYYYLDGELYGVTKQAKSVNSVPGYIVFSSYLAPFGKGAEYGGYSGWYGISDPNDTDYTMEVEWLHVYK